MGLYLTWVGTFVVFFIMLVPMSNRLRRIKTKASVDGRWNSSQCWFMNSMHPLATTSLRLELANLIQNYIKILISVQINQARDYLGGRSSLLNAISQRSVGMVLRQNNPNRPEKPTVSCSQSLVTSTV